MGDFVEFHLEEGKLEGIDQDISIVWSLYETLKTACDSMMPIINVTDGPPLNAVANPDWTLGYDHLPFSWSGFM